MKAAWNQGSGADWRGERSIRNTFIQEPGSVALVGGGPGDPELLTLKALRLLRHAEVVVYDALIDRRILALASPDAELKYVGKECDRHTLPQHEINQLLVRLAQQGRRVVRLKGGDPYLFGRGAEEAEALLAHGIPFEVVPGITAACGMAAHAGIPLTHRDYAQTVTFATGHLKDGSSDLDWQALARPGQTLVIYMGIKGLGEITQSLMQHGMAGNTPAALVQNATRPDEKVVLSTLEHLQRDGAAEGVRPPALIVIGQVASLHPRLRHTPVQDREPVPA